MKKATFPFPLLLVFGLFWWSPQLQAEGLPQNWQLYDSKGAPRALGLNFTVGYPPEFRAKTGGQEGALITFTPHNPQPEITTLLTIGVQSLTGIVPPGVLKTPNGEWNQVNLEYFWTGMEKGLGGVKGKEDRNYGDYPGKIFTVEKKVDSQNQQQYLNMLVYVVIPSDELLLLECIQMDADNSQGEFQKLVQGVCTPFIESLAIK
jgi:hypothetical protein